jgi:putative ATP-binding cassette transporter
MPDIGFFDLLRQEGVWGPRVHRVLGMTIAAGLMIGLAMTLVNYVAGQPQQGATVLNVALFVVLTIVYIVSRQYSVIETSELLEGILAKVRERIMLKVRKVDLGAIEALGRKRIAETLSHDCFVISEAGPTLVRGTSSAVTLVFAGVYVATLSLLAFGLVCALVICAIVFYRRSQVQSRDIFLRSRAKDDAFFAAVNHFLQGFREVKVNYWKGDELFHTRILADSRSSRRLKVLSIRHFTRGINTSSLSFLVLMGLVIFALPSFGVDKNVVQSVTYIILFINAPIDTLVLALPELLKANVAVANLRRVEAELDQAVSAGEEAPPSGAAPDFQRIELDEVVFSYVDRDRNKSFTVGPLSMSLNKGEILFVSGGNGSGKSTLLRLVLFLQSQAGGTVRWDGTVVGRDNAADYRLLFSPIFYDFHLFDRLYGLKGVAQADIDALLVSMEIDHKVSVRNGIFSTLDLSSGQRRRLALIVALLEDKPILMFDEWAADQDPAFRRHFYETILPGLKAKGKTVIAVTHDERYYSIADRVLHMEEGVFADGGDRR